MFDTLRRWWQRSTLASAAQAHITFGATSVGRTITRTSLLLKRQLWIWPILAVALLAAIGFGIRTAIERTMRESLRSQLETLVNVETSMLETWLKVQEANAESLANSAHVRELAAELLAASQPLPDSDDVGSDSRAEENASPPPMVKRASQAGLHARLANELGPGMSSHNFVGYILADKDHRILSATTTELIGRVNEDYEGFLASALDGNVTVSAPFPSIFMMKDERGRMRTGLPTMFVCAPIRDANLQVVAAIGFRIRPEREFTRILHLGQVGVSGETYAIDKAGLMVSNSRFDDALIMLGLLPDLEDAKSILTVSARDPGGDLTQGFRPKARRAELPLTKPAAAAISGTSGVDMAGYNDYRGVRSVGAWRWLPKYNLGIITEVDYAEAFRPLSILRWVFFSIFGLLILSSIAIFVFTIIVARLQRDAQKAAIEARHLGQYRLEEQLGEGAMGVVYRGQHAMLRRPTAIKMLSVDKVNEASIQRFEREVQITCKLNHPNTVAIYDYGRTPEGVFYYAMEFLDGINLQELIEKYGPQPEARVIGILKQICGSLYEAHTLGLVHRDIKPANVMLNRRGGEPDVVKVLDFGLVKALDDTQQARQAAGLSGTPLYMSPEAIQTPDSVDGRSDLYAVGAIGYFLVTGKPVFEAGTLIELCQKHVISLPVTPSERLGRAISPELEAALLSCLEKNRAKRPQTARDLAAQLSRAATANGWSLDDAEAWWGRHERNLAAGNAGDVVAPNTTAAAEGGAASPPPSSTGNLTSSLRLDQTLVAPARNSFDE
jgi:predicted Ser/Thr protein kinase